MTHWVELFSPPPQKYEVALWNILVRGVWQRAAAGRNTTADAQKNRRADRKRGRKESWEFVIWWRGWKEADRESSLWFDKCHSRSFTITSHYICVQCWRFRPGSNDRCSNLRELVTAWWKSVIGGIIQSEPGTEVLTLLDVNMRPFKMG